VGAYSYSDGLETLVEAGMVNTQRSLGQWLEQELRYGAIRLETAVMIRAYQSVLGGEMLSGWATGMLG
jgi:urease accessory protein